VLSGSGSPLEKSFQQEMETTFQTDLSGVREFRGPAAARASEAVAARAFTVGQNIVYGSGGETRQTRIHELTHVAKPITQVGSTIGGTNVTDPNGAGEREAEENARQVAAGGPSRVTGSRPGGGSTAARLPVARTPEMVRSLQQTIGNTAVSGLLARLAQPSANRRDES
jgi:hypothetical protein